MTFKEQQKQVIEGFKPSVKKAIEILKLKPKEIYIGGNVASSKNSKRCSNKSR